MIVFLDKCYASRDAWERDFPVYAYFWDLVLAGAKSPHEIEVMAWQRRNKPRGKAKPNPVRENIKRLAKAPGRKPRKQK